MVSRIIAFFSTEVWRHRFNPVVSEWFTFCVVIMLLEITGNSHLILSCSVNVIYVFVFLILRVSHRMDTDDKKTIVEAP